MIQVRLATEDDINQIADKVIRSFFYESKVANYAEYDRDAVESTVRGTMESPYGAVLVAVDEENNLAGATGALLYPIWCSPDHLTGQELFWYVLPEYRRTKAGKRLFEALQQWASEAGAGSFSMVALDGEHSERLANMYKSKGYEPWEQTFIKKVN